MDEEIEKCLYVLRSNNSFKKMILLSNVEFSFVHGNLKYVFLLDELLNIALFEENKFVKESAISLIKTMLNKIMR